MIGHSVKVTGNNFRHIWSLMLYKIAVVLISFGLIAASVYPIMSPVLTDIKNTTFIADLKSVAAEILSGNYMLSSFSLHLEKLNDSLILVRDIFGDHALNMLFAYLAAGLILLIASFLLRFSNYTLAVSINDNMSSDSHDPFFSTMIRTISPAVRLTLAQTLIAGLYDVLLFAITVLMLIYLVPSLGILTLTAIIITVTALLSLRSVLFGLWLPEYIANGNKGVFATFVSGAKLSIKKFWKNISTMVIVVLAIVAVSIFLFMYTFGVGLFIVVPLVGIFLTSYYHILYYNATHKSYYVAGDDVVTPPVDLDILAGNFTLPEEEVIARAEELRRRREKMERGEPKTKEPKTK